MSKKSTPKSGTESVLERESAASRSAGAAPVSLVGAAGYRFKRDNVELSAQLSLAGTVAKGRYALELWASPEALVLGAEESRRGAFRVARLPLDLPTPLGPITHDVKASVAAKIPLAGPSYFMTLRLVHEVQPNQARTLEQIPFSLLETFPAPCFAGHVGCNVENNDVVFEVDRIESARSGDNVSGTLSLELRAAASADDLADDGGTALATFSLSPLSGGYFIGPLLCRTSLERRQAPGQSMFVVLREYTGEGYALRDYRAVSAPHVTSGTESDCQKGPTPLAANDIREVESAAKVESPSTSVSAPVSLQMASLEELTTLEGITLKIAKEIIKSRPFEKLTDLLKVKGVGQKTLDKLKGRLTL